MPDTAARDDALAPRRPASPPAGRRDPLRRWRIAGLALPFAALALLEVVVRQGWLPNHLVPAPSEILDTLARLGITRVARHVGASTLRVAAGFAAGAGLALVVGAAMGLSRRIDALFEPTFQALRAIPSLAWVPVLLLWLGIDEAPKITLIAIGAFFPVHLAVVAGIRDVDRKLVEVGHVFRLSRTKLARRILLPAVLPEALTALRSGLGLGFMFVVAAEFMGASEGLGYLLVDGQQMGKPDQILSAIIAFALLGKLADSLLVASTKPLVRWQDTVRERL